MISASDILRQSNPFESSIQQILQIDGLKKQSLEAERSTLNTQKKALDTIGSSFSSFQSILNNFSENSSSALKPLKAATSSDAFSVVATEGLAQTGNFDIQIDQIAKRDSIVTSSVSAEGTELSASGSGSFEISVGSADPITIDINTQNLSNDEILSAIRDAINSDPNNLINASKIQVTDSDVALSLKSEETGSSSQLSISNIQGDFQSLDFNSLFTADQLDAKFTVDGIDMTRSSNVIENAIEGLTFELNSSTTDPSQLSVTRDTESALESVESFIDAFNELNSEIRKSTRLNGETGERGILQRERSIRNLSFSMRQSVSLPVSSLAGTGIQNLADLGISIAQDGTLAINDSEKLESLLVESPDVVEQFFTAPDGIVQNLKNSVESSLSGNNNLIDIIKNGIDTRIDRTDSRIVSEERFLERREEQLRTEFSSLNRSIEQAQRQFNEILLFQNQLGFSFNQ